MNYLSKWNTLGAYCGIFSSLRFSALNSNLPGGGRNALWYILFYYFLVAHQNFKKFDGFSYNLSGTDILIFYDILMIFDFLEIRTGFCSASIFSEQDAHLPVYLLLE